MQTRLLRPQLRARARRRAAADRAGTRRSTSPPSASPRPSRAHGPDAVAFYISGQLLTEDYYVFNKLAKGLIGTNNVDTNSRLCMSQRGRRLQGDARRRRAAVLLRRHRRAPTACSSPARTPPSRTRCCSAASRTRGRRTRRLKIVVVDPRRTETAAAADLHLQIQPGTDVALFNGMLHVMLLGGLARCRLHRRAHRAASRRSRRWCATSRRKDAARRLRHRRGRPRAGGALVRHAARPAPTLVALLPGPQPEHERHREERRR